jgi:hypothetical protein
MTRTLAVALVAIAGCAGISENDCRSGNWYALGEREALAGMQPQIERYAGECGKYGVQPSHADYMAGWGAGYSEWNNRTSRRR